MRVLLIALYDEWCLGLRTISSVLKARGHEVRLVYLRSVPEMGGQAAREDPDGYHVPPASVTGADFEALARLTHDVRPGLVGISVSSSNYHGLARRVTSRLRHVTDAPIVWGGADASANPDLAIASADMVCVGEGEGAAAELADRVAAGGPVTGVANLWVRHGDAIERSPLRPLVADLDSLPWPDFDPGGKDWIHDGLVVPAGLPDGSHLTASFPVMATRGCPYSCSYCCNSLYRELYGSRGYVRTRSVRHVLSEIAAYVSRHPDTISVEFHDDVFGIRREWLREFAAAYPQEVGKPFFCYTYPMVCDDEYLSLLKASGVGIVCMGIQTGSQRTLREVFGRPGARQRVVDAAERISRAGLRLVIDLIGYNPFESDQDNRDTLDLLLDLPRGYVLQEVNQLGFYRGYPITATARERGMIGDFLEGRNVAFGEITPAARFWRAIHTLTQFRAVPKVSIRDLAGDLYLKQNPKPLEDVVNALVDATYVPGTRIVRSERERYLEQEVTRLRASLAGPGEGAAPRPDQG